MEAVTVLAACIVTSLIHISHSPVLDSHSSNLRIPLTRPDSEFTNLGAENISLDVAVISLCALFTLLTKVGAAFSQIYYIFKVSTRYICVISKKISRWYVAPM
jgi:hypothetical protein